MIIGDVTNDGEKISHIEFKEKLENINTDELLKDIAGDLAARLLRKVKRGTSRFTSSHQLTIGAVMKTQEDFRATL